jgi:hypothetical protein
MMLLLIIPNLRGSGPDGSFDPQILMPVSRAARGGRSQNGSENPRNLAKNAESA